MKTNHGSSTLAVACLLIPVFSFAQAPPDQQRTGKHHKPPAEAFEACLNKSDSDTCEVITPRGNTINGMCKLPPNQNVLVCVPKRRIKRGQKP